MFRWEKCVFGVLNVLHRPHLAVLPAAKASLLTGPTTLWPSREPLASVGCNSAPVVHPPAPDAAPPPSSPVPRRPPPAARRPPPAARRPAAPAATPSAGRLPASAVTRGALSAGSYRRNRIRVGPALNLARRGLPNERRARRRVTAASARRGGRRVWRRRWRALTNCTPMICGPPCVRSQPAVCIPYMRLSTVFC